MTDSDPLDTRLSRCYNNPGDKQQLFDDWAGTYDHDLVNELGYVADEETCKHFMQWVPDRNARVLDAGCGTGLVGRRLRAAGMDAGDICIRVATGRHRRNEGEELREVIGDDWVFGDIPGSELQRRGRRRWRAGPLHTQ